MEKQLEKFSQTFLRKEFQINIVQKVNNIELRFLS